MALDLQTWVIIIVAVGFAVSLRARSRKLGTKELPGPKGIPLVGNLFQLPKERPWLQMAEWTKEYGPIYRLKMGLNELVVVGSAPVAIELLDKRSAKYSSRPRLVMASELVSRGLRMTFMPYGDRWRRERKLLHQLTQPKAAATYEDIQDQESATLIRDLIDAPQDHWGHAQRYAGSTIMQVCFNKRALAITDHEITEMRAVNEKMTRTAVPGAYLVDSLPFLNQLPRSLAPWKAYADKIFDDTLALFSGQVDSVRRAVKAGEDVPPCFTKQILAMQKQAGLNDEEAIFLAGAMFGAGSDTTSDAIETFLCIMTQYPDVLQKAQAELDQVIGHDRLPDFADEDSLPYCTAVVRETMRWRSVIAGGLAHMTTEDDVYDGYYIPKGTTVLANHWAIHHDPEIYPEPLSYKPDRFMRNGKVTGTKWSETGHHGFGFGRRICPGIHIANRSLYITFVRIMWALEIRKAKDAYGNEIPVDLNDFTPGFSSHPRHFETVIRPRGEWVNAVVKAAVDMHGSEPKGVKS